MNSYRVDRDAIAGEILGAIDENGYCRCPGESLHTHRNGSRHCRVYLQGVPSIYCVHDSCNGVVEEKNKALRSAIGKAERGANPNLSPWKPSAADREREREQKRVETMRKRAAAFFPAILERHAYTVVDFWESSVYRLDDEAKNDWRPHLRLFAATDVVWIGQPTDSGPGHERNFRTAAEWLKEPGAPNQFTTGATFKGGSFNRSKENIVCARYFIIESDTKSKDEFCAVIKFMATRLWLRAIVDTGGKSLHAWFEPPKTEKDRADLVEILPLWGCDHKMFTLSQPCRLAGAPRDNTYQHLVFLDLEGLQ